MDLKREDPAASVRSKGIKAALENTRRAKLRSSIVRETLDLPVKKRSPKMRLSGHPRFGVSSFVKEGTELRLWLEILSACVSSAKKVVPNWSGSVGKIEHDFSGASVYFQRKTPGFLKGKDVVSISVSQVTSNGSLTGFVLLGHTGKWSSPGEDTDKETEKIAKKIASVMLSEVTSRKDLLHKNRVEHGWSISPDPIKWEVL